MTPIAIVFLTLAVLLVWGGLAASIIFLSRRGEIAHYPAGDEDLAPGGERLTPGPGEA